MIVRCSTPITRRGQSAQAQNRAVLRKSNAAGPSLVRTAPGAEDASLGAFRDGDAPVCRGWPRDVSASLSSLLPREDSAPVRRRALVFAATLTGRMCDCAEAAAARPSVVQQDQPPSTKGRTPAGWLSFEHRVAKLATERFA
jgi:hypothetical protein